MQYRKVFCRSFSYYALDQAIRSLSDRYQRSKTRVNQVQTALHWLDDSHWLTVEKPRYDVDPLRLRTRRYLSMSESIVFQPSTDVSGWNEELSFRKVQLLQGIISGSCPSSFFNFFNYMMYKYKEHGVSHKLTEFNGEDVFNEPCHTRPIFHFISFIGLCHVIFDASSFVSCVNQRMVRTILCDVTWAW